MINDFVLLRFRARTPEDLRAIEVIYLLLYCFANDPEHFHKSSFVSLNIVFCCRLSIHTGNHFNDLTEIELVDLSEPSGWIVVPLKDVHERPIRTFMIQITVVSNHQNGRDTHMRQIKIHSPVRDITTAKRPVFTSVDLAQFSSVR